MLKFSYCDNTKLLLCRSRSSACRFVVFGSALKIDKENHQNYLIALIKEIYYALMTFWRNARKYARKSL